MDSYFNKKEGAGSRVQMITIGWSASALFSPIPFCCVLTGERVAPAGYEQSMTVPLPGFGRSNREGRWVQVGS